MGQQIAYPLVSGSARDVLTVTIVVTLALTSVVHAWTTRGATVAIGLLVVTAVPGFAVEVLGVHTGVPFGHYTYTGLLGPRWFGVPLVIGLAWTMLAWPAVLAARHLVSHPLTRLMVAAATMTGADLFLDPQLVHGHYWRWTHPSPGLPGVHTVPLTNLAGWAAVSLVLCAALGAITSDRPACDDLVPLVLLLWLYLGWIVALAVFGDLQAAAGWGALALAPVVVPLAVRTARCAR